ncbi:MAG TPA: glycosyltransferase [Chthonomonadaceae bacterium]|nr:glycosyltransferase [Chthonomonadaceae bacterium]
MQIALFSECYLPVTNGVVTSLVTLRETLRSWGHTVYIIAPGIPQPDDDADVFRLPELPFPRHPYHFARPFPRLNIDFACLQAQIVHCHHPFTVGSLGAKMAQKYHLPMIYTAHSLYDSMMKSSKSSLVRTMGEQSMIGMIRRFCSKADTVIVPSRYTREALRADGVEARFAVVPSGIVPPVLRPEARAETRQALGLAPEAPLLLCVGRLGPEKRVDILLRAVAILRKRRLPPPLDDFRLALVGDGQTRKELEMLARDLELGNRVVFVGAQPHTTIGDWYAAGDIFVMSSPVETQGLVLVEAMAAGLPCIAADYGGAREVVVSHETGLCVSLTAESFADAIEWLLRNPDNRRRFAENGKLRAQEYSPETMAQGVLDVYEMALRSPSPLVSVPNALKFPPVRPQRRRPQNARRRL